MYHDLEKSFSKMTKRAKKSAIRELLKLTNKPGLISFAGGLPAPCTFPSEELKEITNEVLTKEANIALQYGTTEGDDLLREQLTKRYQSMGLNITKENLVITTSSQQALDFLGRVFINEGDKIIVELPSYLGGLQAFNAFGADMEGIKSDEFGMCPVALEKKMAELSSLGKKPKFIYVIPDFQNPSGITMPESRRKEIIDIAHKYEVLIVEDSPYRELRFDGEPQKTIYQLDEMGTTITLGTFSKIFVPGFRIGWIIAHPAIVDKFVTTKQSVDLCTPAFVQRIAARYMEKGYFEKNLKSTIKLYGRKKEVMMESFEKYMPDYVTWTNPEGGLFLFVYLPEHMDAQKLFLTAVENNVAFVIGQVFHCDGSGINTMRINFSFCDDEKIVEGVKRLAAAIKEYKN
ncbi:MAG: PLP-dependent aminotransferase family protein [bacterium]|jgi:2-aminoadipate transaminase|nr:PLP-dependent aminotransferase family protein [bacterium]